MKSSLSIYQQKQFEKQTPGGIFPEYYIIKVNNFDDRAKDSLDEWIYYLKHTELPVRYQARGLALVAEKLKYDNMGTATKKAYDKHLENVYISRSMLETAKLEGREEGKEEGIEKGIGKTALNLYKLGVDIEVICSATGLSKEELERIIQDAKS